jgi:acetate kinase
MHILVLNSGSSSLKFKLLDMPGEHEIAWGVVERIGEAIGARLICSSADGNGETLVACRDHAVALNLVFKRLAGMSTRNQHIDFIGHRIVHGGGLFSGPTLVDAAVISGMTALRDMAPMHMPPALAVLKACRDRMPNVPQMVCFDTTFYCGMPAKSYLYAVPREWYTDHGVRRFGFHGLSHQYVTIAASEMLGIALDRLKLITAHLGNGASITAFDRGCVLDTSMGFTPLEGLIMGTRAGYIDPAVLPYIQSRTGMTLAQMVDTLNTRSGLAAISGMGRDMRTILAARAGGHAEATLAVDMYVHTLRKYAGAYTFALGGAHALVFTGGVGENAFQIREMVLSGLGEIGVSLDEQANHRMVGGRTGLISSADSRMRVLVIPTNEECMIARQAYHLAIGAELLSVDQV